MQLHDHGGGQPRDHGGGPGTPARPAVRDRIAWLLRVNRLFGREERWAKGSLFAAAFPGGCWPGTANESKISRWETAMLRVPYLAIRRYEELLGLASGLLTATAENIQAYYGHGTEGRGAEAGTGGRAAAAPPQRVEELIDKARSSGVMTGHEWDELTRHMAGVPQFYIHPSATWTALAERLLEEQIIADRVAWLQRFGALVRLLNHPVAQRHAIAACAALAADPLNQVGIEVTCAMDITAHPDASRHVLSQLTSPTSDMTFYGALLACVRKVAGGHFTTEQCQSLAEVVVDLLADPARHDDARTLAASLLRQIPDDVPPAVASRLRRAVAADESVGRVMATGRLGTSSRASGLVGRVVSAATSRMPREGHWLYDDMLAVLLDEMLYDPVPDVRLEAAFLIHATPYRAPVAAELADGLSRIATAAESDLAVCIMDALRLIGGPGQRPAVERITVNPCMPAPMVVAAARNIGHLGGTSDDRYWNRAIGLQCQPSKLGTSPASTAILRGLVYGLGMARNDAMLARIREIPAMPSCTRQAASWWLGRSERTRQSAAL